MPRTNAAIPHAERPYNSWDALKLIALLLMFIDHAGLFFFPHDTWLRAIGRGAAPIFLFLAGYASSYAFKRDILLLAVLIAFSGFCVSGHFMALNILFLILLCRAFFQWMKNKGRHITRPYEWFIGCWAMFSSMLIFQYGSVGLLFALCGYMMGHTQYYTRAQQQRFLALSFLSYGLFTGYFSYDTALDRVIMTISLGTVYLLLRQFNVHTIPARSQLSYPATLTARYSGYIFAFHIIALEWITGIPY